MPDQETYITALLVDDDEDDRAFFCEAMGTISHNVICVTAEDGVDAFDFLRHSSKLPDFIFLDLNMPRMNGKDCLRELKQNKRYGHMLAQVIMK
jgi:CheY-like chemotaxis protein